MTSGAEPACLAMADLTMDLHGSFPDAGATIDAIAASAVKIFPVVTAAAVVRAGKGGVLTCQAAPNPCYRWCKPSSGPGRVRADMSFTEPVGAKVLLEDLGGRQRLQDIRK